jgi:hypothetical protein
MLKKSFKSKQKMFRKAYLSFELSLRNYSNWSQSWKSFAETLLSHAAVLEQFKSEFPLNLKEISLETPPFLMDTYLPEVLKAAAEKREKIALETLEKEKKGTGVEFRANSTVHLLELYFVANSV